MYPHSLMNMSQPNHGIPMGGGFLGMVSGGGFGGGTAAAGGLSGMGGLFSTAGSMIGNKFMENNTNDEGIISDGNARIGGALKGAGMGASIGSVIPGVGTLIGAGAGALLGGLFGNGNEGEVRKMQSKQGAAAINNAKVSLDQTGSQLAMNANLFGNQVKGLYAMGGFVPDPQYKVEDGEMMVAPAGNPPMTDVNGSVSQVSNNMFKFNGDDHSDPSGGIGVDGGQGGFVFSNRLKADADKYLRGL